MRAVAAGAGVSAGTVYQYFGGKEDLFVALLIDDPALAHWVWDSLIGVADDLLHAGSRQSRVSPERLVTFATRAIERGIVAGDRA